MVKLITLLLCAILFSANVVFGLPPCTQSPEGQWNCEGAFVSGDQNAQNIPNLNMLIENLDPDVTPWTQCTDAESNVTGKACCVFQDTDKTAVLAPGWTCGSTFFPVIEQPTPIRSSSGNLLALKFSAGATTVGFIIFPQATDKPDEANPAVAGTIAWAIAQFGTQLGTIHLVAGTYPVSQWTFLSGKVGGIISGAGQFATNIEWRGDAISPVILVDDMQNTTYKNFRIRAAAGTCTGGDRNGQGCWDLAHCPNGSACTAKPMWNGIVLINGNSSSVSTPIQRIFDSISIDGFSGFCEGGANDNVACSSADDCPTGYCLTGLRDAGVLYAAPLADDCTAAQQPWVFCSAADTFTSGYPAHCCNPSSLSSCNATSCTTDAACSGEGAFTKCVLGTDGNQDFDTWRSVSISHVSGDGVGFDIEPTQAVGNSITNMHITGGLLGIRLGGRNCPNRCGGGQASITNSFFGGTRECDIHLQAQRTGLVKDNISESGTGCFVRTGGPSASPFPAVIEGNDVHSNSMIASSTCAGDDDPYPCCSNAGTGTCEQMVLWQNIGPLTMVGNFFGNQADKDVQFKLNIASGQGSLVARAENNFIRSTAANPFVTTNPTREVWLTAGNVLRSNSTYTNTASSQKCAIVENLKDTDDAIEIFQTSQPALITSIGCRCKGTCSPDLALFTLANRAGTPMTITGTNPTCATTGATTYAAVTGANALPAGDGMNFTVSNSPTLGDTYTICFTYLGL